MSPKSGDRHAAARWCNTMRISLIAFTFIFLVAGIATVAIIFHDSCHAGHLSCSVRSWSVTTGLWLTGLTIVATAFAMTLTGSLASLCNAAQVQLTEPLPNADNVRYGK